MGREKSNLTNKWYEIFRQEMTKSCAPACIRMFAKVINGTDPGEALTRNLVGLAEGGSSTLGAGGGLVGEPKQSDGSARDFNAKATVPDNLVKALKGVRPPITAKALLGSGKTTDEIKKKLESVSPNNPMIIGVKWKVNGSGHVIVAIDRDPKTGKIVVLDPALGIGTIDKDGVYLPKAGLDAVVDLVVSKD